MRALARGLPPHGRGAIFVLSLAAAPRSTVAEPSEIRYRVTGYADDYAIVLFTGPTAASLSTSLNAAGTVLRVSGVQAQYRKEGEGSFPPRIVSANQVARGPYTDLIFTFRSPSTLSATPGVKSLKLLVKAGPGPAATGPRPPPFANPVTFERKGDGGSNDSTYTVRFPELGGLTGPSALLRRIAYIIDLAWVVATGGGGTLPPEVEKADADG